MMDGFSGWRIAFLVAMAGGGIGVLWVISKQLDALIKEIRAVRHQLEETPYRTQDRTLYGLSQRTAAAVERLVELGEGSPPPRAQTEAERDAMMGEGEPQSVGLER